MTTGLPSLPEEVERPDAHPPTEDVVLRTPGAAERDPVRHTRRRRIIEVTLAVAIPVLLIGLWQLAASEGWIDRILYPAPTDVITEGRRQFADFHYGHDVWVTVKRILWGFFYGSVIGIAVGLVMGMSRTVRAALEPTLSALYTVPKLALLPVFLIIFGVGEKPVIVILAVTVFFFVWIQTMASVMSVPEGYREAAVSFGVTRRQMFRHVILPGALPQIFVGLRIAAGVAVLTVIGVEFVFAPGFAGLGYRINNARQTFVPKQAYVGIVISAVIGVIFIWIVKRIGRALSPWAPEDNAIGAR
jgi:sulfonate transport system permease protein